MKLYKKLPIIYLVTFPFYILAGMMMVSLAGFVGYLLAFWFVPVLMMLRFINTIAPLSFLYTRSIPIIFISNLIFWFLVGLLIDKLFNKVKNRNGQSVNSNPEPKRHFLFLLGLAMFSISLVCQFIIVGIDPFAALNLPITFLSLYVIPVVLLFLGSAKWSFFKKILVIVLFLIYLAALARLLTFFKTGELFIKDKAFSSSFVDFSRNSEYGVVLSRGLMSVNDDKLYLLDVNKKNLYPIATDIPIIPDVPKVLFSTNGGKVLYGYGKYGKPTESARGVGLRVFNITNAKNEEIISFAGEYSFETASKYYGWFSEEKPYLYGWIDENKIGFSCTKESENMRMQLNREQDKENNFLYCVYDSNTGKVGIVKNAPKLFDGNLTFSMPYDPNNWKKIYPVPNSNNKIRINRILHGFDGSTAVEVYLINPTGNEKLLYRGHFFELAINGDNGLYVTSKGSLFIKKYKKNWSELIKIY